MSAPLTAIVRTLTPCLLAVVMGATRTPALATEIEPWANAKLPVKAGLVAWYDASNENAARAALKLPKARDHRPLAIWHDGSGHSHHLEQPDEAARPVVRREDELSFVRFDGNAAFLRHEKLHLNLRDTTMLIVAAPFINDGGFRGFLATNADGVNDYVSGITIDQSAESGLKFHAVNVEGAGFGGARNLKRDATPLGHLERLCVTSTVGPGGTALYVDGQEALRRDRAESSLKADRLTVGARFYTNGGPATTRGFLAGDIAEVIIYDRVLSADELKQVDAYLLAKYGARRIVPIPPELLEQRPVPRVSDPPKVQFLAPGFTTRRLPIELSNVNNVRYRADGKLMAMAYDGKIYRLTDTDGDGLEDKAAVFWDQPGIVSPIGIALTPPGYPAGQGVFVAAKGQVVLVLDTDGDDRGDKLVVVAEGWKPLQHSVDAMGMTLGPDGSVYFGLGVEDFTNAYLLDAQGRSHFDPATERGAIFRVSPDFKNRERLCTGVRFSVALAFNRDGDLFCTDQEGATWLANGNPFDELLHIQPGKHYGFPPRHPRHLPGVIDEPSVYDYSPQHQSTCGLCFNEAVDGQPRFGPAWWQGNAFACGYSRGKLFRTTLSKTPQGYVADSAVLASLSMLTVDCCLSPKGELLIAAHSGGPDWGSGPRGAGTLYKVTYADQQPQPVRAWAATPHEVHVAFDRPLTPAAAARASREMLIEYGPNVRAGDRFESLWPGYAVVEQQMRSSRKLLPVLSTALSADARSLILTTDAHLDSVSYAVVSPSSNEGSTPAAANSLPQRASTELTYDLAGVEARWTPKSGEGAWSSWLPHFDPAVSTQLLAGTAEAERLRDALARPGTLRLRTQFDLRGMLRPAVQPGSTVDESLPPERVSVTLAATQPFVLTTGGKELRSSETACIHCVTWAPTDLAAWLPVELTIPTGQSNFALHASWTTAEDDRPRAFAPRRFLMPWARMTSATAPAQSSSPELAGGDWHRGQQVFYSTKAQCGACHRVRGKGGWIGPDLTNLVHRDYASVLRDISQPSFAINPDHLAYTVALADGRTLTGMVQPRGEKLCIGDIKGVETLVPRSEIESMTPAAISIMPEGLPAAIGAAGMRDLLTFLLTAEPGVLEPAPIEHADPPAPRTRAEVGAVLKGAQSVDAATLKELNILLVAGPKDHGPGEHDYPLWQRRWNRLLGSAPRVRVTTADLWPSEEQWKAADVAMFFSANPAWTPERAKELDAFQARGGGLVFLHFAVNGQRAPEELAKRIGLAWRDGSRFRHGPLELQFPAAHPITANFSATRFVDESYWNLLGDVARVNVLATQIEEGQPRPLLWTFEPNGGGRVFCSILGHYNWTFDDPLFRVLTLRGMAWAANQPIDRFNELVTPGARVSGEGAKN